MAEKPVKAGVPDYEAASDVASAGEGGEAWYPEIPRVAFEALLGKRILVDEVSFRDSEFDQSPEGQPRKQYALLKFRPADKSVPGTLVTEEGTEESLVVEAGEAATTMTGGVRVVDQLKRTETFPAKAEVGREKTKTGYNMWVLK